MIKSFSSSSLFSYTFPVVTFFKIGTKGQNQCHQILSQNFEVKLSSTDLDRLGLDNLGTSGKILNSIESSFELIKLDNED